MDGMRVCERVAAVAYIAFWLSMVACGDTHSSDAERIQTLYKEASEVWNGSLSAEAAIRELGELEGEEVDRMLIDLAFGRADFSNERLQAEAVHALSRRGTPELDSAISPLVSPAESIITRFAVVRALEKHGCRRTCLSNLLAYLFRLYSGEVALEDQIGAVFDKSSLPPDVIESVRGPIRADQQDLVRRIHALLLAEPDVTAAILADVYGIGSPSPQHFAIDLIVELKLAASCEGLRQSEEAARGEGLAVSQKLANARTVVCQEAGR